MSSSQDAAPNQPEAEPWTVQHRANADEDPLNDTESQERVEIPVDDVVRISFLNQKL